MHLHTDPSQRCQPQETVHHESQEAPCATSMRPSYAWCTDTRDRIGCAAVYGTHRWMEAAVACSIRGAREK
eukprot:1651308-Alexandrium_andersonii.AAC.1